MRKTVTVWFDGQCPLCRREIAIMRRLDRRASILFLDARDGNTDCPIDRADLLSRFHAEENGRLLSGAAAFAAMWRAIPLLRPIGLIAGTRAALPLFEAGYKVFLKLRPDLQKILR